MSLTSNNNPRELPERSSMYLGRLTDTSRWDAYRRRDDDVFICTPPKCGTTWTQAICGLLILGTNELYRKLTNISPWFDSKLEPVDVCVTTLDAQCHRRFIKTHTPLDGIPYFTTGQYFIVYRNPIDAYFSTRNHLLNMNNRLNLDQLDSDPRVAFRAWVSEPFSLGAGEQRSLAAYAQHFNSFWQYRHLPNLCFLHYSDMKRDVASTVQRIAQILNIEVTVERIMEVCKAVSFTEMKKNAATFAPASGKSVLKSESDFFSSGANNQGALVLGDSELRLYESAIDKLLPPAEKAWVENGGNIPTADS